MTYIVGPNAQGKTNILESIYLLALTKSFRTTKQQDMIGWDAEYTRVKGFFEVGNAGNSNSQINSTDSRQPNNPALAPESLVLEAFLGKPPNPQKSFKKNDVKISATNFIGNCQVVFFHPEDLNMLYLGPDLRRNYLNVLSVQVNRKYFSALRSYQKILKQRNALLHAIRDQRAHEYELEVWDEQLAEHGAYLMFERANMIQYFQQNLTQTYQKISQGEEKVRIHYRHTLHALNDEFAHDEFSDSANTLDAPMYSLLDWHRHFSQALLNTRPRDLQALVTTVGPHRDDLDFTLNGLKLSALASRGEYRSLLLALKLIELKFFEDMSGQNPILLLDDVFSELDPQRQNLLLQAIEGHQTIITTTHIADPDSNSPTGIQTQRHHQSLRPGKFLEISQGTIYEPKMS